MTDEHDDIQIPDSPAGILTARDYRKQAQHHVTEMMPHVVCGINTLGGRSGLSADEKRELLEHGLEHFKAALPLLQGLISATEESLSLLAEES